MEPDITASSIDERVALARNDKALTEELIGEFQPFLKSCAARYASQNLDLRDELYGTAMLAFYEAIKSYDIKKGHFFSLMNAVVRRRMIDAIRKLYRENITITIDDETEEGAQSGAATIVSMMDFDKNQRQRELVSEIEQFKAELSEWEITMSELVSHSPKHQKLRDICRDVVKKISVNEDILQIIGMKHYLPMKKIVELTGVPLKKLERSRTFIIASLIIKTGDYDYLSEYVTT